MNKKCIILRKEETFPGFFLTAQRGIQGLISQIVQRDGSVAAAVVSMLVVVLVARQSLRVCPCRDICSHESAR